MRTSPISVLEVAINLARVMGLTIQEAQDEVAAFLETSRIATVSITPEIGQKAIEAYGRYGRGSSSKAQLNLGDVFSYACAKAFRIPLLYKGNDFAHTDLAHGLGTRDAI